MIVEGRSKFPMLFTGYGSTSVLHRKIRGFSLLTLVISRLSTAGADLSGSVDEPVEDALLAVKPTAKRPWKEQDDKDDYDDG